MPPLPPAANPLPWFRVSVLMFCFLADTLTINAALPLAPFMVQHFFKYPSTEQNRIGYYSGLIASSYTLGQICTGPFWGGASDRHGRRPILLFGLLQRPKLVAVHIERAGIDGVQLERVLGVAPAPSEFWDCDRNDVCCYFCQITGN